jgi:hypothetical protein
MGCLKISDKIVFNGFLSLVVALFLTQVSYPIFEVNRDQLSASRIFLGGKCVFASGDILFVGPCAGRGPILGMAGTTL